MAPRPEDPATDETMAPAPGKAEATGETMAAPPGVPTPRSGGLRPGTVVGDSYEVTRLLGQGGMGAVWEAKHLRLPDKRVVVKVLLYGATEPVALARFRREAEIASRLGHPNIVQVLDFNTLADGSPYIVLELLQGESLAARLARGRMPLDQVTAAVSQIGAGLAAAHRAGIVHRDLKPDNIFLCPTEIDGEARDVAKILDFGISKIRGAQTVLTQDSTLIGTPQYMAPEQATGRNDAIDARTDIFAFGAIVFEMLAGRPPFTGDTLATVIHAVVYGPTPPLAPLAPEAPPAVIAAVERALAKRPEERFPDVASFVKAVTARSLERAALGTAPTQAQVATPPSAPKPETVTAPLTIPPRRGRSRLVLATLVAGAVVVVAAALLMKGPGERPAPPPTAATPPAPLPRPEPTPAPAPPAAATEAPAEAATAEPRRPAADKPERPSARPKAALSPEVARELEGAEAALAAGKFSEAIRLAQHSLYAQQSSEAYALIARARCGQGDIGNAKAALAKVAGRDRAAVVRACGKLGVAVR
jgi:serine/threonine protein kinase